MRTTPHRRPTALPIAAALCLCAAATPVQAGDADAVELWPSASLFQPLGTGTRAYFDASYARGRDSDDSSLDLTAAVDTSLKPVRRPELLSTDWERARYVWSRIGFTHLSRSSDGEREVAENRGVAALHGKFPLASGVWLEGRARADLRWIGADYSTRYRARVEATREFEWRGRSVVPYANAEAFYDTRYDGWSRALYQLGAEIPVGPRFRYELYVASQRDRLPQHRTVNAIGIVLKWYR